MMVLFANIPFIKYDDEGNIRTGPNEIGIAHV